MLDLIGAAWDSKTSRTETAKQYREIIRSSGGTYKKLREKDPDIEDLLEDKDSWAIIT